MPIVVSCACGKQLKVKDDLAGKKIRCSGCQAVVQVPATKAAPPEAPNAVGGEHALPKVKLVKKAASVEAGDDFAESPAGIDGKKKKIGAKAGSRTTLYVLLGCGVLLLLLSTGIAGYFFLAGPGDPEREIVGAWQADHGDGTDLGEFLEFKADGTFSRDDGQMNLYNVSFVNGRWKSLSKKGNTMTVEVTYFKVSPSVSGKVAETKQTLECTVVSHNVLQLRNPRQYGSGNHYKRFG